MNQLNIEQIRSKLITEFGYDFTLPPDINKGILTTNQAFIEAKKTGKNPVEAAVDIKTKISEFLVSENIELSVTQIGPYINLSPTDNYLNKFFTKKETIIDLPKNESTLLEFFSPNVGKRMHIGHMRSANIGESIRRILNLTNTKLITDNHIADWGVQFGILIWGTLNLEKLKLGFNKIDWENDSNGEIVEKLSKIYIKTNELINENPEIGLETKKITAKLETNIEKESQNQSAIFTTWQNIINSSIINYSTAEAYLNLHKTITNDSEIIDENTINQISDYLGVWQANKNHKTGQFDLILGESFYQNFLSEIDYWVKSGIATKDGDSIYVDLEDQKLGRCYLITSAGYSIYAARDIIARFVWAGLFQTDHHSTFADNRQSHSFKQVFAVIKIILESGIYKNKEFGLLTLEQTQKSLEILSTKLPQYLPFGFISLPEGAMSSRKGTVILLEDFIGEIESAVKKSLEEKSKKPMRSVNDIQKIQKISTSIIKWYDLARDREQDYIFDINKAIQFEGNTGIYQLYTIARLKNILKKTETTAQLIGNPISLLNQQEKEIITKMLTVENIIMNIASNYKPHHLCNYLFELTSMINSWYAKYSVGSEPDDNRRDALLHFVTKLVNHLEYCINLLGIETVEEL